VDAEIRVAGHEDAGLLADLSEWLRGERALAGKTHLVQRLPREGELGSVSDVLAVSLGAGGTGVALAGSLTAWLRSRRSDVGVTVTTELGTVTVNVSNATSGLVHQLLRRVLPVSDE
jgi:hypothetical protein